MKVPMAEWQIVVENALMIIGWVQGFRTRCHWVSSCIIRQSPLGSRTPWGAPRGTVVHLPIPSIVPATLVSDARAAELGLSPGLAAPKLFVHFTHLELAGFRSGFKFCLPLLLLEFARSLVPRHVAGRRVVARSGARERGRCRGAIFS